VVSRDMGGMESAGDLAENVFEQRYTFGIPPEADFQPGFFPRRLIGAREKFRNILLVLFQYAYAEQTASLDEREQVCQLVDADGNQRRDERDRGKRVCGHTVNLLRFTLDRNHGYARGKLPESTPEVQR